MQAVTCIWVVTFKFSKIPTVSKKNHYPESTLFAYLYYVNLLIYSSASNCLQPKYPHVEEEDFVGCRL